MNEHRQMIPQYRRAVIEFLEQRMLLSTTTINWNDVHQTVDGFGSESAYTPTPSATVIDLAYSTSNGIGLSVLRGSLSSDGTTHQVDMMKAAKAYGVRLVMSPRGPALEWIADLGGDNNGYLMPSHYQDYANFLADYVQNSAADGIPIDAISLAVEPDMATTISPIWTQQEFADLLPIVANTFRSRGITTKIMLPETVPWDFTLASQIMADPALAQYVDVLADHGYDQSDKPLAPISNSMGKPLWMTETILNDASLTPMQNALWLASNIHDAFTVADASMYLYYWMNGGDQYLMSNWVPNKRFWALGNYSRFVRPGWVMIGETDDGGLDLTTFKDPVSGKFAIVAVNSGTSNLTETYNLSGISATSVTPYVTSATDDLKQYGAIALSGNAFSATIAAGSVVTYYGISTVAPALQAPGNLAVAAQSGFQTSHLVLSWVDNSSAETGYTVERSTNGTSWSVLTSSLAADTNSYVDLGANEAITYFYRVKATNGALASAYSPAVSGTTILAAPSGLTSTPTANGLTLTWTSNSAIATGATIQRSLDGLTWNTIATLTSPATSYSDNIPGYNANQIYFYRVRNTVGARTSAYAQYNTPIATPMTFNVTLNSPTTASFTWSSAAVGAFAAVIQSSVSGWQSVTPVDLDPSAGSFTLTGLAENKAYTFRLAVVAGGAGTKFGEKQGAWSAYKYVSLTTPIPAPANLTAIATAPTAAVLTWKDNSTAESAYSVERSIDGVNWSVLSNTLAAGTTSYTDTSAPAGTAYYRVKATAGSVSSAYARTQRVTAAAVIIAPTLVSGTTANLAVTPPAGFGSGTLTYTWSIDGTPPSAVYFSNNGTSTANNTAATFSAAGSYQFRVTIADAAGNATSAAVVVAVQQTVASIGVTRQGSAIVKSTWQQLTATAFDQFGIAMSASPTFTWSVVSGGGSVSTTGLFSAPSAAATPVVRATAGPVTGSITLTVLDAAQLVADYGFNETQGWNVDDTVGAGIVGKLSGGAVLASGHMGNAVQFDGVSGSTWIGRDDALTINGQITLAAWVKPASLSGNQMIVSRMYGPWPYFGGTYLRINNGKYEVGYYDGGHRSAAFTIPVGDLNTWVHLAGTYDGTTWRLYRNGVQVATYTSATGANAYSAKAWRIGSSDTPGQYFNGTIDSVRLYAQALSASEVSALYGQSIRVTSAPVASPQSVGGKTTLLSVSADDPDTQSDQFFTYTWSSDVAGVTFSDNGTRPAKNAMATFTKAGSYNLTVTITDLSGLTTARSVRVDVQPVLSSISVSPASPSLSLNGTQQFGAVAYDQFGTLLNVQPAFVFTLANGSVGAVSDSGLYTAPSSGSGGNATIIASSGSVSGTAGVAVTNQRPSVATTATASNQTSTTVQLNVLGSDDGGEANLRYTWTASGPAAVTFATNGGNSATLTTATFSKTGSYNFTVTIADGSGLTATSAVAVTVLPLLRSISVAPTNASVAAETTLQFTASGVDQFGSAMSATPAWSASGTGNSISSTGLFTAGTVVGSYNVTATSGTVTTSVPVNVTSNSAFTGQVDFGNATSLPGSYTIAKGAYTVKGAGSDIWSSSDSFHFVYVPLSGDGQIVARVTSVQNTNSWAKAGVMLRDTLAANARNVFMAITPGQGATFQQRTTTGGSSSSSKKVGVAVPYWVKLVRSGSSFQGYYSADGVTWTALGSTVTIAMGSSIFVGLAVTSHNSAALCTATFDNVSVSAASNLALGSATTSSSVASGSSPAYATDANAATSWTSASGGTAQWLRVDLGTVRTVSRITLSWGTSYASSFRIETSRDGASWTTQYSTTAGNGGTTDATGWNVSARYVRIYLMAGSVSGYIVKNLAVSGY
jgi:O-glycosyl hydrolase